MSNLVKFDWHDHPLEISASQHAVERFQERVGRVDSEMAVRAMVSDLKKAVRLQASRYQKRGLKSAVALKEVYLDTLLMESGDYQRLYVSQIRDGTLRIVTVMTIESAKFSRPKKDRKS